MRRKNFLSRINLWYIISVFSTAAVLILQHRQVTGRLSRFHLIAYWLINSFAFLEAWQFINMREDFFLYRNGGWIRKVVSAGILPLAVIVANVLFPYLLEGYTWPGGVVITLFCILGFVAGAHGFLGTLENLDQMYTEKDEEGASHNQTICAIILVTIATIAGGSTLLEEIRRGFTEVFEDLWLAIGAFVVFGSLLLTFLVYPYVIKKSIKSKLTIQKTTT